MRLPHHEAVHQPLSRHCDLGHSLVENRLIVGGRLRETRDLAYVLAGCFGHGIRAVNDGPIAKSVYGSAHIDILSVVMPRWNAVNMSCIDLDLDLVESAALAEIDEARQIRS